VANNIILFVILIVAVSKMRLKSGRVVYRRRAARIRPHSVVRRYLPCLLQTTGNSDTDSEYDTQLSGLLDHQHQQPIADGDSPIPSTAFGCDTVIGSPEVGTIVNYVLVRLVINAYTNDYSRLPSVNHYIRTGV